MKCGFVRTDKTIFDTINFYLRLNMPMQVAIAKAESDLHTQLPYSVKKRIMEVCKK